MGNQLDFETHVVVALLCPFVCPGPQQSAEESPSDGM